MFDFKTRQVYEINEWFWETIISNIIYIKYIISNISIISNIRAQVGSITWTYKWGSPLV